MLCTRSGEPTKASVVCAPLIICALMLLSPMLVAQETQDEATDPSTEEPLELGLEEEVEVRLVLIDFLVLDRKERTVPDLTIDDFELWVERKPTEIASLDRDCPVGLAADPNAKTRPRSDVAPTALPRRIVLVFDYLHMTNYAETFDRAQEMLDRWPTGDEEHMIVSLGQIVRIENPFTTDLDELRWTLRRMRNDRDLFAGNYARLHETRFFDRVKVMFDLLEPLPGRKTIVLFSGPFMFDGFEHDPFFRELSAMSTTARTAVYPVDTGGLRPFQQLGGPPKLRRLANETGGRMTSDTNDIGVAYARAHRDLGCNYTLGFYDRRPKLDKHRRYSIRLKDRKGARVVFPGYYVIRSPQKKRRSLFRTASMAPHMFENTSMDTELFVLGPRSSRRWQTLMGVQVRMSPEELAEGAEWDLKGILRKPNGTVVQKFRTTLSAERFVELGAEADNPVVSVFREFSVPPGDYFVSAVLSGPPEYPPRSANRPASLAKIPRGAPFLIGPILGHRSSSPDEPDFQPLLASKTTPGQPLEALTLVCVADSTGEEETMRRVIREVSTLNGENVQQFDDVIVELERTGDARCRKMFDRVETLNPGEYELNVRVEATDFVTDTATAEFTVGEAQE